MRFLAVVLLGGCATGTHVEEAPDGAPPRPPADAPQPDPDGDNPPPVDAPSSGGTGHSLLLTEVVLAPSTGEFVEIANPTSQTVDLSTYYVSDSGAYFRMPGGVPTVDANDFIVKFPAGATIAPGAVVTVALDTAASFQTVYGVAPTFSVASATMTGVATNSTPTLTNGGELIVLFEYTGTGLVHDVDMILAGAPTVANGLIDKSGQTFGASAYATDARTMTVQTTTPGSGVSTKRIAIETGHEAQNGTGNGIAGDDETSEDTAATWDATFTAPTPGTVPPAVLP